MTRQTLYFTALSFAVVAATFTLDASAQNTFRRKTPLRWLGQGFSDGYHKCNPGYDSSHYNPYSAHNSFLYSQTLEFRQLTNTRNFSMSPGRAPQFFGGIPFSVYAAPPQGTFRGSFAPANLPNGKIESTFEPAEQPEAVAGGAPSLFYLNDYPTTMISIPSFGKYGEIDLNI